MFNFRVTEDKEYATTIASLQSGETTYHCHFDTSRFHMGLTVFVLINGKGKPVASEFTYWKVK